MKQRFIADEFRPGFRQLLPVQHRPDARRSDPVSLFRVRVIQ
jgi:hypothetical protein